MVTAFTIQGVRVSGTDFCVDTDLGSYPGTDLTLTATFTGTTLHVSNILPTDACLLVGMTVTGGGLPAGTTIQSGVTLPQAGGGSNVGDFVLNNAPSSGTTFHAQTPMIFLPHPAPRFTCINSTGNRVISQQSGGPPDIPFGSFFKQQFSGGFISAPNNREQCVELIGNLMYCTIDVWKPYTGSGAGTLTIYMCGWHNVSGNYVFKYVAQVIDLTTPGSRTIRVTAAASSPLGADSFVDVPFYMSGGHAVLLSANGGGDTMDKFATFTITGQCFQGIEGSGLLTTTPDGLDYLSDTITQAYVP
jgi:hypothetical protein